MLKTETVEQLKTLIGNTFNEKKPESIILIHYLLHKSLNEKKHKLQGPYESYAVFMGKTDKLQKHNIQSGDYLEVQIDVCNILKRIYGNEIYTV